MEGLKVIEDGKGRTILGANMSTFRNAALLAASTAEYMTVPKGATKMIIGGNVDFWLDENKVAVVPAADITNGTSPLYIAGATKELRDISGITKFSVISTSVGIVTAEYYG